VRFFPSALREKFLSGVFATLHIFEQLSRESLALGGGLTSFFTFDLLLKDTTELVLKFPEI